MKRVCIITEGGRNIGIGHITRCISLCQAFEEKGITPEFIVNGDDAIVDLLINRKHQIFNWLSEKDKLFQLVRNADITIVDSYLADVDLYKRISEMAEAAVYIDDNKRLDYPRGFVVNGSIYAEKLDYPKRKDISYLLGSQYIPIRKEFWNVVRKEIKDALESVMITFGGDDSRNMTPKILGLLCKDYSHLTKKVIIAKRFKHIDEIKAARDKKTEFIYSPGAKVMKEIMLSSDIAVTAGGQTLYELARIGVPTVAICIAENQLENAKGWQKTGFIKYAGRWEDKDVIENVLTAIKGLENRGLRLEKSLIGRKFVDGRGSSRVRDILLGYKVGVLR